MIPRTTRYGFRGGIHFCLRRFTDKQIDKDYEKWMRSNIEIDDTDIVLAIGTFALLGIVALVLLAVVIL